MHVDEWPDLSTPGWLETAEHLHLWTQLVGKTRLAFAPFLNHWWQVPLYVTARGLGTSLIHVNGDGGPSFELEFDLRSHQLLARGGDGRTGELELEGGSVASFFLSYRELLADLGVRPRIWTRPVELPDAVPFEKDTRPRPYDRDWAERFLEVLHRSDRALQEFRAPFLGKASPVHFFWGSFDLAVSRFSGRPAPTHPGGIPNCPDWVTQEAYSHEESSAGFWPGGAASPNAIFYSFAYPEPDGYARWPVRPDGARYEPSLKEFVLPYEVVRRSETPEADLRAFFESTYEAAAELGRWDRIALERQREDARLPAAVH